MTSFEEELTHLEVEMGDAASCSDESLSDNELIDLADDEPMELESSEPNNPALTAVFSNLVIHFQMMQRPDC